MHHESAAIPMYRTITSRRVDSNIRAFVGGQFPTLEQSVREWKSRGEREWVRKGKLVGEVIPRGPAPFPVGTRNFPWLSEMCVFDEKTVREALDHSPGTVWLDFVDSGAVLSLRPWMAADDTQCYDIGRNYLFRLHTWQHQIHNV